MSGSNNNFYGDEHSDVHIIVAIFAAIIGVFLIPNAALAKKHHHSSDDDTSTSSSSPSATIPNCEQTVSVFCASHDLGKRYSIRIYRMYVSGLLSGLSSPTDDMKR
jgi:hypothetical protein